MATINGTEQDDQGGASLVGTAQPDDYFGLAGDDSLISTAGDDTLDGGTGRDTARYDNDPAGAVVDLAAGTATDGFGDSDTLISIERVFGSTDHGDTLSGGNIANLLISGQGGNDSITADNAGRFSNLFGGTGDDTLTSLAGEAFIEPGAGQDQITGSGIGGDDTTLSYFFEAQGTVPAPTTGISVTFTGVSAGTVIDFAGDTDSFTNIDDVRGTDQADTFVGAAGRQEFTGHQGNDTIDGGAGVDTVDYSRSSYAGASQGIVVDLIAGTATDPFGDTDSLSQIEDVVGTDFADSISGNEEANQLFGEGADDTLNGAGGEDTLFGAAGADSLDGGTGADLLVGGSGNDILLGSNGRDTLSGGGGDDTLDGGAGTRDEVSYTGAAAGVTVDLATGTANDGEGGTDTLLNVEVVIGSALGDTLTGAATSNSFLQGAGGDDLLQAGSDTTVIADLDGGTGNDTLTSAGTSAFFQPGSGDDSVSGSEAGFDVLSYFFSAGNADPAAAAGVTITFTAEGSGTATDWTGGTDTFSSIERLEGTMLADTLTGAAGYQEFRGFAGNDSIDGGADLDLLDYSAGRTDFGGTLGGVTVDLEAGTATDAYGDTDTIVNIEGVRGTDQADTISGSLEGERFQGGDGADLLEGRDGNDRLEGDDGDDTLDGGLGDDTLIGGAGGDTFVVGTGSGSVLISDFELGVDTLDLTAFSRGDGFVALDTAVAGSAVLTFADGTVVTVDGDGVTPDSLTESDISFGTGNVPALGTITIDGTPNDGETATANITDLSDPDGIRTETISYQWQRDGADIAGAISASYVLTTQDVGTDITVVVSYTDEDDNAEAKSSVVIVPAAVPLVIDGDETSEALAGGEGNDTISGNGGDDTLTGAAGDDALNGGAGTDTASYSGNQASYTLTLSPTETTLTDRRAEGNGTDTLAEMEFLDFDTDLLGNPFNLGIFAGPAGLNAEELESFIELYIAYFNRAPDAVGLNFWGTAFANGTTLQQMATLFIDQDETVATYPPGQSNAEFATAVYNNVLGRVADQGGFDFWVRNLDSGAVSRDQFILAILDGAKADPPDDATQEFIDQQLADRQYLTDKIDIGAYFAVHKGMSDTTDAAAAMNLFDGTQTSIDAAVAAIDGFFADALDPDDGAFLMPLVGVLDDPFTL